MYKSNRVYFMDSARAILMFLGIPYHLALIYERGNNWEYARSADTSVFLSELAQTIHTFRMPLFFALAGYFAAMILKRKDTDVWLRGRFVKLGVPLLVGMAVLNPISFLTQGHDAHKLLTTLGDHWFGHLWFLPTLLVLFLGLALAYDTPIWRMFERYVNWTVRRPVVGLAVMWVLAAGLSGASSFLGPRVPHIPLLTEPLLNAIGSLPFLLMGAAMYRSVSTRSYLTSWSNWMIPITVAPLVFILMTEWSGTLTNLARVFALTLIAFGVARGLFSLCSRYLNTPSKTTQRLVDASFTVYLVHVPMFNAVFPLIEPFGLPVFAEYLLLLALVSVFSYLVHLVIAQSKVLLFLFNGTTFSPQFART